jgi:Zn-dependent protease
MWLSEVTLQLIMFRLLAITAIVAIQGSAVTTAAWLLGEKGPKQDARLTLNPSNHLDLTGTICFILFGYGWAKPISVQKCNLRFETFGIFIIGLTSFFSVLILAAFFAAFIVPALTVLPFSSGTMSAAFLKKACELSVGFALFNLVPLPPLTMGAILPKINSRGSFDNELFMKFAVVILISSGLIRRVMEPIQIAVTNAIL